MALDRVLNNLRNEKIYGKVLRAKGIIQVDDNRWVEFDYLPKQIEIRDSAPDYTGRICVIGINLNKENLQLII
ncbi:CobW C-terminal domain-containing protein [Clostridium algoriphilum]|uniref:GTP-binding protein n=1 Tax=Clostridium algoriphilum TaxID=198347 RepID=UPI00299F03DD|nr:GTP-binding protein [Clostridium algoriphilum]